MSALDLYRLDGRVALVTGGAGGIGSEVGRQLAGLGARVVLADRSPHVHAVAASLKADGADVDGIVLDVTDRPAVDAAIDAIVERTGSIDIAIANAGLSYEATTVAHDDEWWHRALDINLTGVFHVARHAGRHMVRQGRGAIVAISSIAGVKFVRPERHVGYDVAKAGVAHMCRVLGCEWVKQGVRVNAVGPGYTNTEMLADVGRSQPEVMAQWLDDTPAGRLMERREIASAIAFLVSDAASGITGQLLMVDGGYSVS